MELTHTVEHNIYVIPLQGELLQSDVGQFLDYVEGCVDQKYFKGLILNMEALTYVDSQGVGAFMTLSQRLKSRRQKFAVCGLSDSMLQLFSVIALDEILTIYPNEHEALAQIWEIS